MIPIQIVIDDTGVDSLQKAQLSRWNAENVLDLHLKTEDRDIVVLRFSGDTRVATIWSADFKCLGWKLEVID